MKFARKVKLKCTHIKKVNMQGNECYQFAQWGNSLNNFIYIITLYTSNILHFTIVPQNKPRVK